MLPGDHPWITPNGVKWLDMRLHVTRNVSALARVISKRRRASTEPPETPNFRLSSKSKMMWSTEQPWVKPASS